MSASSIRLISIVVLLAVFAGCSGRYTSGSVNGVTFEMSAMREPIPGGTPYSIAIRTRGPDSDESDLLVDGVRFGIVRRGDDVDVTRSSEVYVNGELRQPQGRDR